MNVCSIWPFAQISDDFYCLGIWQCATYFVAALLKELALTHFITKTSSKGRKQCLYIQIMKKYEFTNRPLWGGLHG